MRGEFKLPDEAALFLAEVGEALIGTLPSASEWEVETEDCVNSDRNIVVGEF